MYPVVTVLLFLITALAYSRLAKIRRTVKNPKLGILDLSNGRATALAAADKAALADVFQTPNESRGEPPHCDVLLVYGDLDDNGRIMGYARGLREIIRDADAKVVVLASENDAQNCAKARARKPYGQANLVITFARRGEAFPVFFRELFCRMKAGSSMPQAWVQLAPQNPNQDDITRPSTIFMCELGAIRFE